MRRVVITGLGIVSSIGNDAREVEASLRAGRSGITFQPDYAEHGFRSQVAGVPDIDLADHIEKRDLRFQGPTASYAFISMQQAIADAGLEASAVSNERTGLIAGSGGPSTSNFFAAHNTVIEKGAPKRMGPFMVTRCMSSTVSACLATPFSIKGVNYSISSACSTSAHCIGAGVEQIQFGKQDIVFAGGGEEVDWTLSCLFDAMGAMSSKYNDTPETASRPFDASRDGFVIGGGGGMVVPSGEGGERSMRQAIATIGDRKVDYINAHGTSTPAGDVTEVEAVRRVFGEGSTPPISSTKSLTGHSLGATGVHEAIYCMLMMQGDFIAASANVTELDPAIHQGEIATTRVDKAGLDTVLSNSFGFGGTNATLLLSRFHG